MLRRLFAALLSTVLLAAPVHVLGPRGGRLLVRPEPDEAAREILAHLRRIGVLAPPTREPR